MSLSVIIPTWRRPEVAARTVSRVLAELVPGDECLVVIQGPERDRAAVRAALAAGGCGPAAGAGGEGPRLRVLDQARPGRCAARNRALRAARGRWVALLDDDTLPRAGWRDALIAPLEAGEAEVTAGRLWEEPDRTTNAPRTVGGTLTWTGHTRRNYRSDRAGPTGLAPSGNMALARELALAAGGFDEGFGGAEIYEDVEFSLRLRRRGARLRYVPEAGVDHLAVRTGPWWEVDASREVDRARHMSLIFRRHRPLLWPVMATAYLAAALLKVLRRRLPVAALLRIARGLREGRRGNPPPVPLSSAEGDLSESERDR